MVSVFSRLNRDQSWKSADASVDSWVEQLFGSTESGQSSSSLIPVDYWKHHPSDKSIIIFLFVAFSVVLSEQCDGLSSKVYKVDLLSNVFQYSKSLLSWCTTKFSQQCNGLSSKVYKVDTLSNVFQYSKSLLFWCTTKFSQQCNGLSSKVYKVDTLSNVFQYSKSLLSWCTTKFSQRPLKNVW